mgnify:CR=1 FL=1
MARPQGSRNALIRITYDDIGRLAGISGNSAKQNANRGEFDSRSLDSALTWINARRTAIGLSMIGIPEQADPNPPELHAPSPYNSGHNPLTGEFEDAP